MGNFHLGGTRTDPTYKEWKPGFKGLSSGITWLGTDPTYKEWKLVLRLFMILNEGMARILPTRNGNQFWHGYWGAPTLHGSYLQGMETLLSEKGEQVGYEGARILPTRNGNGEIDSVMAMA